MPLRPSVYSVHIASTRLSVTDRIHHIVPPHLSYRSIRRPATVFRAKRMLATSAYRSDQPKTFSNQPKLPRLPVPDLEKSLDGYLKSLIPVLEQKVRKWFSGFDLIRPSSSPNLVRWEIASQGDGEAQTLRSGFHRRRRPRTSTARAFERSVSFKSHHFLVAASCQSAIRDLYDAAVH